MTRRYKPKSIPQLRAFPLKSITFSLIFYLFFLFILISLSDPFVLTKHISACFWDVTDAVMEERYTLHDCAYFFYFNDESGKRPRWNIYYTKHILLRRKLTRKHWATTCLQYVDLSFPHFCETSVSDLANIFGLWLITKSGIWISDMCIYIYVASEPPLTRHLEIKNASCLV